MVISHDPFRRREGRWRCGGCCWSRCTRHSSGTPLAVLSNPDSLDSVSAGTISSVLLLTFVLLASFQILRVQFLSNRAYVSVFVNGLNPYVTIQIFIDAQGHFLSPFVGVFHVKTYILPYV